MQTRTVEYYDWFKDFEPEVMQNLCDLLRAQGIDAPRDMHGGYFKDGKWVGIGEGEYRNFWHCFLDCWGDDIRNDTYVTFYFPESDEDDEWQYHYDTVVETRGEWARDLVTAVRKVVRDHNWREPIVVWFSW